MELSIEPKKYVDWKVYNVTTLKNRFGFRLILYFEDGSEQKQQIGGFTTRKAAKEEREKVVTELNNGTYVVDKQMTTKDFLEYWLEKVIRPNRADNTYVSYSNAVRKHIVDHIGNIKLNMLNRGHIQKMYDKEFEKSQDVTETIRTVINSSMNYARKKKLISSEPGKNVRLPKKAKKQAYRTRQIDVKRTLNLEQIKVLIEASKTTPIHLQVLFAVLMGLRRGEINGLKYTDIDYINRKIKVQRQLGVKRNTKKEDFKAKTYTKQEIELKTYSSNRELDIPDYVFEAILAERKQYEKNKSRRINCKAYPFQDLNYICCSSYGRPRSKNYNWQHFKKLLKENNLPDIRWHDLRATYSTLLMKNDFNVKAISQLMGHAKEIITADIYGDTQEIIEDCLEVLEPFIERVIPKEKELENDFSNDEEIINGIEEYIEKLKIA